MKSTSYVSPPLQSLTCSCYRLKVQNVPVDQLVFLKSRVQSRMTSAVAANSGVLVSSEHGDACCYELTGKETAAGVVVGSHDVSHMI